MKATTLVPQYYTNFSCIGPECEMLCCNRNFLITMHRDDYLKLKQTVTDPEMAGILDTNVKRLRGGKKDYGFATITMDQSGLCPFLKDGLCGIQKKYGADALTETCAHYPRVSNCLDSDWESSLALSCPEATRLCLLRDAPMEFKYVETEIPTRQTINLSKQRLGATAADLKLVRDFTVDILQNRRLSLQGRLLLLGMYIRRAREIPDGDTIRHKKNKSEFIHIMDDSSLNDYFLSLPSMPKMQITIMAAIFFHQTDNLMLDYQLLKAVLVSRMKMDSEQISDDVIISTYQEAKTKCYDSYLTENIHIVEHYLVILVFQYLLPISHDDLWNGYLHIISMYALIHFHLVAYTAAFDVMNDEKMVSCVTLFTKALLHNKTYLDRLTTVFTNNDWDDLAHIAVMLRD